MPITLVVETFLSFLSNSLKNKEAEIREIDMFSYVIWTLSWS